MDNIKDDRLRELRLLAKSYAGLRAEQFDLLVRGEDLLEICNEAL
jgi:hypothetical protein